MVGKVLFNGRIHSPRLPQRTQNSGETGHLRNRIIRIRKGIQNIFHRPGAINPPGFLTYHEALKRIILPDEEIFCMVFVGKGTR